MQDVSSWLAERLMSMPEASFAKSSHRKVPEVCRRVAEFNYFAVPLANGIGSAVLASPKESRQGEPVLVILCHALGFDATYPYWHWIEALNRQGLHVLSLDWDGHGVNGGSALDMQTASRSIPLVLQKLYGEGGSQQLSISRRGPQCFLMGHAAGASYSLLAASRMDCAKIVSGVIAVSPTVNTCQDGTFKRERWTVLNPVAWFKDYLSLLPFYGLSGVVPPSFKRQLKMFPLRLRIGIDREIQLANFVNETFAARRVLKNVKTPVLWFHGARDKRVPLDRALSLMTEIPSALFTHVDENRGHTRIMYAAEVPAYAAKFIDTCASLKNG
ncbi:MAG: alpha/beta fold hydrolase [Silvanigrellaceae bacterium]